jgi:hypothetical protein
MNIPRTRFKRVLKQGRQVFAELSPDFLAQTTRRLYWGPQRMRILIAANP